MNRPDLPSVLSAADPALRSRWDDIVHLTELLAGLGGPDGRLGDYALQLEVLRHRTYERLLELLDVEQWSSEDLELLDHLATFELTLVAATAVADEAA